MQATFPDGVYLVQLSSLRDPDLLASTVTAALGLPGRSAAASVEPLLPFLRGKRLLLILDTCEHLIDACAEFAHALLRGAAGPRVLATSRQALGVPGEVVYPLLPLAVPDGGGDAVALFADRARAALPGFTLTDENRAKVVALCQGLEGIPLAIELAAVRLRAMRLDELLGHLGDRLRLLRADRRNGDARHQTLRTAIQWSYRLCSPAERLLWARLSVFAGEFGIDAVERVCGYGLSTAELVDALVTLVDKSIVLRVGGDEGGARYRMLDAVRDFGAGLLADQDTCRRRHRDYYLAMAREFSAEFIGPGQADWVRRVTDDQANFRLALEYCLSATSDAAIGLELATLLLGFWTSANRLGEGRYWLARMLNQAPGRNSLRVTALCQASWLKDGQGDGHAWELLDEARSIAAEISDEVGLAWVDGFIAHSRAQRGDMTGVTGKYEEVLARMRQLGDRTGVFVFSFNKAAAHGLSSQRAECVAELDRLLGQLPEGECWLRGWALWVKGATLWRTGDRAGFAECARAALPLRLRFGDVLGLVPYLEGLAWLAAAEGDLARTARLQGAADRMWREVVSVPRFGMSWQEEEHDTARDRAHQALGGHRYEREHAAGAALSTADAVQYALSAERPGRTATRLAGVVPAEREPGDATGGPWEPLTAREKQVAALVAEGMTNREIAARLVVSKRTVDAHVEHILSKLGFSSRVQVAVLATVPAQALGPVRAWAT
jgi:non-specific serine/threonine protein kinase